MSLTQKVAARFAARATIKPQEWKIFSPGEYIHGEVFGFHLDYPVRGYLTQEEIATGKREFQKQLKLRRDSLKDHARAVETRSGPVWKFLLDMSNGDEAETLRFVEDYAKRVEQAERAKSVDALGKAFSTKDGPAFFKGEPLMIGSVVAHRAAERAHLIHLLEMSGTSADIKNFAKTKAKIDDKPDILDQT